MSSTNTPAHGSSDAVLINARDQFLASLLHGERVQLSGYDSATDLIKHIQDLPHLKNNKSRMQKCLYKVGKFNAALSPYFESIGWVVQSHPEFVAIGWGAIKFVLQLASNYASFFEQLLRTLHRLAVSFPPYQDLAQQRDKFTVEPVISDAIYNGISTLYAKLLQFLYSVVQVFREKDGTLRTIAKVTASLLWKPFNSRFHDLIEDIEVHRGVVKAQIEVFLCVHIGGLRDIAVESKARLKANQNKLDDAIKCITELEHRNMERFDKDRKASTVTRLRQWIHPPEFALKYERALNTREEGTADWLFSNPDFVKWQSSNSINHNEWLQERVLWLYGNPGSGKTILAASTVQELRDMPDDNVCYFFFEANDPDYEKPEDAYRSILAQTLQFHRNNETVLDKFAFILQEQSSGQSKISTQEALDLIKLFAMGGYLQCIVLDGVDECSEWVRLASTSSGLPATLRGTPTKLLLLGRPHLGGHPLFSQCSSVSISDSTSEDIRTLIQRRLQSHVDEGLLPIDVDLGEVTQRLHTGAGSMILWAHLMLSHLASIALTVSKRMEIIRDVTLPEGLDKMYDRIIEHLLSRLSAETKLSQWILMWLVYSRRPLTSAELRVTTMLMDTKEPVTAADFTNFERTVISTCASLVEKNETVGFNGTTLVPSFRIIHLSAHEYLRSRLSQQAQHFMISSVDAQLTIARCCLQYFSNLAPKNSLEVENSQSFPAASFDKQYPLCAYAALHWIGHLANADAMNDFSSGALNSCNHVHKDTLGSIRNFIGCTKSLLAYVQAKYTFGNGAEHDALNEWKGTALRQCQHCEYNPEELQLFQDVQEFAIFLHNLDEHWGGKLSARPSLVWHEVTAFTPCRFIRLDNTRVFPLISPDLRYSNVSSKHLSQISEVSEDQNFLSVLTVWPSKMYEEKIATFRNRWGLPNNLRESCKGWIVRYQIWSLDEKPNRVAEVHIPIEEEEVWRQYCHSLSYGEYLTDSMGILQFPITISPCLYKFSVLRTIHTLQSTGGGENVLLRKRTLPLGTFSTLALPWPFKAPKLPPQMSDPFNWSPNRKCAYIYSLTFDTAGACTFFLDWSRGPHINIGYSDIPGATDYFTAFRPVCSDDDMPPCCAELSVSEMTISRPAFHPTHCLIAFSSGCMVYLWAYKHRGSETSEHCLDVSFLECKNISSRIWALSEDTKWLNSVDSIHFSEDGKFVVVRLSHKSEPIVTPVPDFVFEVSKARANPGNESNGHSSIYHESNLASQVQTADLISQRKPTLHDTSTEGLCRWTEGFTSFSTATGGTVELHVQDKQHTAKLELLQLPNSWGPTDALKLSVGLHRTRKDIIRVILNQAERPWYSIGNSAKRKSPTVIDRKTTDLRPGSVSIISHRGSKDEKYVQWFNEGYGDSQMTPSKRLRPIEGNSRER